jgi:3-oxoacyl-[acyl-carrier-protein] synthase-3
MKIIGTGFYVPPQVLTNEDISDSPQWVIDHTGIKERHVVALGETSTYLGTKAGRMAIEASGLQERDIDMIIVATATPDKIAPSTACMIKGFLGCDKAVAFDINAVCSGFLFAMSIAQQYLTTHRNILIIGVDTFSSITDWADRNCVFFGDGAGAVVVTMGRNLLAIDIYSDSNDNGFTCDLGSTFKMNGKLVYETALRLLPSAITNILHTFLLTITDVDYMIPHQPSNKVLLAIADKIGLPREKVLMNMDKYANTSAGTIPILLSESWSKLKEGDIILFAAIGAGWTYGVAIYKV